VFILGVLIHTQSQMSFVTFPRLQVSMHFLVGEEPVRLSGLSAERQAKLSEVEIKNGKVIFRQKPMSFEKMTETMQGA
jgi:hypothetical protein